MIITRLGWNYNNNNMYRYRMGGCGFLVGITFAVIDNTTGLAWQSIAQTTLQPPCGGSIGIIHARGSIPFNMVLILAPQVSIQVDGVGPWDTLVNQDL